MPGAAVDVPPPPNAASLRGPDLTRSIDPGKFAALLPQLDASANERLRLLYISIGTDVHPDGVPRIHPRVASLAGIAQGPPPEALQAGRAIVAGDRPQ